jgi:hypothetical protein
MAKEKRQRLLVRGRRVLAICGVSSGKVRQGMLMSLSNDEDEKV